MPVGKQGRRILRDSKYLRLRRHLIDDVVRYIDEEGRHGKNICDIIHEMLKKERYGEMTGSLMDTLKKNAGIEREKGMRILAILLEEDIARDIKRNLRGSTEEKTDQKNIALKEEGERKGLWFDPISLYLGGKKIISLDILRIIKENKLIDFLLLIGLSLMAISSIMFESIYKAVITGLTLNSFQGEAIRIKVANITGALGGILIFFVTISLVVQYYLLSSSRDRRIRDAAKRYLDEGEK